MPVVFQNLKNIALSQPRATYMKKPIGILFVALCRLLQISSFNGKMNALNEVNKVITSVSYYTHRHSQLEEDEWLTAEKMAVSLLCLTFITSAKEATRSNRDNYFLI